MADVNDPSPLPVFVYGTLRPGGSNHRLLHGRTAWTAGAELAGVALYAGPGHPWAVDVPGGRTAGDLVMPLPAAHDAVLADLDRLEGYLPGDPAALYVRERRTVTATEDDAAVTAWVYLAGPAARRDLAARGRRLPGREWRAGDARCS